MLKANTSKYSSQFYEWIGFHSMRVQYMYMFSFEAFRVNNEKKLIMILADKNTNKCSNCFFIPGNSILLNRILQYKLQFPSSLSLKLLTI